MARDSEPSSIPRDSRGNPTFFCVDCGQPLTMADFHSVGLREPEPGEAASDYMADELVDELVHTQCLVARRRVG